MTVQVAKQLASALVGQGVQVTIVPGTQQASSDWKVIAEAPIGVTVDASSVAALESQFSVTAPVGNQITFA